MIGFGAFGGSPFPTRRAMGDPQSGQVQSDDEFGAAWRQKLASVPQFFEGQETVQLAPGAAGYDASKAQPWHNEMNAGARQMWVNDQLAGGAMATADQLAERFDSHLQETGRVLMPFWQNPTGGGMSAYSGRDMSNFGGQGSHTVTTPTFTANPEWERLNANFGQATKERGENQIRQQQAYDTMLAGDGQVGGVMTDAYSNPNFGQISGQSPGDPNFGGFGGFGGDMTGIQDTTQNGQYMGGAGRYNPSPFAPGAFQNRNPWAGL